MKQARLVGLVGGGNFTRSSISRFTGLAEQLGPVKAATTPVAGRIVHAMRAGYLIKKYDDFAGCQLVLISVPEALVPKTIAEMAAAKVDWRGKAVVLCDSWRDSQELAGLARLGAAGASVNPIHGFEGRYVIEGDRTAVLEGKRVIEAQGLRVTEIKAGSKHSYFATLTLLSGILIPLLAAAMESLSPTGMSPHDKDQMLDRFVQRSLRGFLKAGRKAWNGPLADGDARATQAQLKALMRMNPLLGHCYYQHALVALTGFKADARWLRRLDPAAQSERAPEAG